MLQNTGFSSASMISPALSVSGPQPVWMILNEARERAFTGEVVFETDPEVFAYFDNGIVYFAERASDTSLARRLVDAGVLDGVQLERGTIRLGDVEHLGRLFDRDPSVDRDAVMVMAETVTEELIAELANTAVVRARVTAYRHHRSGLHRWFVAPIEAPTPAWPPSGVAPLGAGLVDDLPGLGIAVNELVIEWDDPIGTVPVLDDLDAGDDRDEEVSADDFGAMMLEALRAHTDIADPVVVDTAVTDTVAADTVAADTVAADAVVGDQIVAAEVVFDEIDDVVDAEVLPATQDADEFDFSVVWPDEPADGDESANGALHLEMPDLALAEQPEVFDAEVSDDVAEAVRRAVAALESATIETPEITAQLPQVDEQWLTAVAPHATSAMSTDEPAAGRSGSSGFGFAPPTMDTRAEVLYGRTATERAAGVSSSTVDVAVAAEVNSGSDERTSALRRLIGSLRRKDH